VTPSDYRRAGSAMNLRDATEELQCEARRLHLALLDGPVWDSWLGACAAAVRDGAIGADRVERMRGVILDALEEPLHAVGIALDVAKQGVEA